MSGDLIAVLLLTLRVATIATLLVIVPATFLGYALARWEFRGKQLLSAVVGLPLVLPPTAVGFLLLRLLATDGPLGRETLGFDLDLLLTWKAAVLAAGTMSIPLVIRTARVAFEGVDPRLEMMGRTLGYRPLETFFRVTLPQSTSTAPANSFPNLDPRTNVAPVSRRRREISTLASWCSCTSESLSFHSSLISADITGARLSRA